MKKQSTEGLCWFVKWQGKNNRLPNTLQVLPRDAAIPINEVELNRLVSLGKRPGEIRICGIAG